MNTGRKEVLILHEDESVLIELERLLQDEGFETTTTWSVNEAVQMAREKQFDGLLLSDQLVEVSRSELLRVMASRLSAPTRVVVLTKAAYPIETQALSWVSPYAVVPQAEHRDLLAKIQECLSATEETRRVVTAA